MEVFTTVEVDHDRLARHVLAHASCDNRVISLIVTTPRRRYASSMTSAIRFWIYCIRFSGHKLLFYSGVSHRSTGHILKRCVDTRHDSYR